MKGTVLRRYRMPNNKTEQQLWQERANQQAQQQQLRQKWTSIFNDSNIQSGSIMPPTDPQEFAIAQQVARELKQDTSFIKDNDKLSKLNTFLLQSWGKGLKNDWHDKQVMRSLNKGENKGAASFGERDITPLTNNIGDIYNAASAAGKQLAYMYASNNKAGYDNCFNRMKQYMQNPCYSVVSKYTFLHTLQESGYRYIGDHAADRTKHAQMLTQLQSQYNAYAAQAKQQGGKNLKEQMGYTTNDPAKKATEGSKNGGQN